MSDGGPRPPMAAPLAPRLPHLAGIDGLRAIAVAAVLLYHAGIAALPGGFLGVEVFFVISGYLITALLLAEWRGAGHISLRRFWYRRARRLLPALFVVLLATLAFAVAWLPDEVTRLRADAAAAAVYVSNWYLIFGEQSYFATSDRQSPLLHLWSLAVEEQFYVVWPIVLAIGLRWLRPTVMLVVTLAGAIASSLWMAALFDPATDPSRVYYGTDTRLSGLLLGAALAFVWVPRARVGETPAHRAGAIADGLVVAGALVVGWAFLALDGADPGLYRGGLALVGIGTVALIAGAVHPAGRAARLVLDRAPLRWLGTRSYAVYLWHWPIFSVTRPGLDVPLDGPALLALRLLLTTALAELSYRLAERPIRDGALGRAWHAWRDEAWRTAPGGRSWLRTRTAGLTAVAALGVSGLLVTVAAAGEPARPSYLSVDRVQGVVTASSRPVPGPSAAATPSPARSASTSPSVPASPAATRAPASSPSPTAPVSPLPPGVDVLALGDSILVDAAPALAEALGRVEVDAEIGRQVDDGVAILEARERAGTLPEVVIVNLGTNGPLFKAQFERAMVALRNVPQVIWVTVTVPRPWEDQTNGILTKFVPRYSNARLADWHGVSGRRPELFWDDGYHPRAEGARLYAATVVAALR